MKRSLLGQRIVVTRAVHQAEELAAPLRELGAEVILLPVIGIAPPADPEPLQRAVQLAAQYDWIIFTSVNAVAAFSAELPESEYFLRPHIATIGAATRAAAEDQGLQVSLTPDKYVAEALVESFSKINLAGKHILIPSAAVTRDIVPVELRKLGASVDVVEAYRTVIPAEACALALEIFGESLADWVTFASSSAVDNLVELIGRDALERVRIATIGPATSESVRKHQLTVAVEAQVQSIEGLGVALRDFKYRGR